MCFTQKSTLTAEMWLHLMHFMSLPTDCIFTKNIYNNSCQLVWVREFYFKCANSHRFPFLCLICGVVVW